MGRPVAGLLTQVKKLVVRIIAKHNHMLVEII
jgi:hypothetical protein